MVTIIYMGTYKTIVKYLYNTKKKDVILTQLLDRRFLNSKDIKIQLKKNPDKHFVLICISGVV